jgi:hypothetical protein
MMVTNNRGTENTRDHDEYNDGTSENDGKEDQFIITSLFMHATFSAADLSQAWSNSLSFITNFQVSPERSAPNVVLSGISRN